MLHFDFSIPKKGFAKASCKAPHLTTESNRVGLSARCSMIDPTANQLCCFDKLLCDFSRSESQQMWCLSVSRVSGCENYSAESVYLFAAQYKAEHLVRDMLYAFVDSDSKTTYCKKLALEHQV